MQIIAATELAERAELSEPTFLVSRPVGRCFFPILESVLLGLPEDQALAVDFRSVRLMDGSFADEVFGQLAVYRAQRRIIGGCLILQELEQTSLDNLHIALSSRVMHENGLRNCVVPVIDKNDGLILVGKNEAHVQQSFDLLVERKRLTARDLVEILQLDISAASTRLKVLFNLGLATRTEARDSYGKYYVYIWPTESSTAS